MTCILIYKKENNINNIKKQFIQQGGILIIMEQYSRDFLSTEFARSIYNTLEKGDTGKVPYHNIQVSFRAAQRDNKNDPSKVSVNVTDEKGKHLDSFNMKFKDGGTDFTIS